MEQLCLSSKHRTHACSPLTLDLQVQGIQKESLCSQVNLPGMLASGALTTRPDLASEPQEPREGLEGRSVLEGLLGFFHKRFTEVHNRQT